MAVPSLAQAVPPSFGTVGHEARHPSATFSAPRASSVTVYIATKPDRATDGSFLDENIETLDFMADSEIQQGRWLSESQLDPGTYWLMLRASPDFDTCYIFDAGTYDPACAEGYSAVVQLLIPFPTVRYTVSTRRFSFAPRVYLTLKASPLGVKQAYRACYLTAKKQRRCVRGTVDGYNWDSSASDELTIATGPLARMTKFQWFVGNRVVAQRTVRVK